MLKLLAFGLMIISATAALAADECAAPFKITTKRDDDRVTVTRKQDEAIFTVHSPRGISHAIIAGDGATWPESVVLRLHLSGLEHFKITNGAVTIGGTATIEGGEPVVRIAKEGDDEEPLDAESPYWIKVRIIGSDGKPATKIPLEDGYFEMELPKALFEGDAKSITVEWIDFYRV